MYDEFPTIYESNLHENTIYFIILGVLALIMIVIILFSLSKIFKKANRSGLSAWVPFYNAIVLLEIVNYPKYYFFLLLIPLFNIYILYRIMSGVANSFRKGTLFAVGLTCLPFIYLPILAFSNNEYIGINLVAMEGKTVTGNIPKLQVEEDEKIPTVNEGVDTSSRGIDISIGGGNYQKNYTNNLLNVDEQQSIHQDISEPVEKKKEIVDGTFIKGLSNLKEETTHKVSNNTIQSSASLFNVPKMEANMSDSNQSISTTNIVSMPPKESTKTPAIKPTNSIGYTTCPRCGAKLKDGSHYCFMCGISLK